MRWCSARPLADVNNAWKNIIGLVGVGLAVGLAVALILATYVARRITHPLRVIGSAADKVARGDLDVNVVGKRNSDDELGQLATRFQGMVDRLREVDELERNFLMRVTHELRTPLTAISGHVQAVTEGVVGPDELDESLEAVNEEVRRLDRLVGDLLDLTRLEAHQFRVVREEVGLEALLEQAAGAFREKARAVDIEFETPIDGAPTVITDGDRVLQIVNNLLDNAFRWTPRGGRVELGCVTSNGIAAIKVTDTGRGHRARRARGRLPPVLQPPRRGRHRPRPLDLARAGPGAGRAAVGRERAGTRIHVHALPAAQEAQGAAVRYHLCDTEQSVTGISIELAIESEPFAESVPYELDAARGRSPWPTSRPPSLTPAELFALGHALLDAAADGFGHFVPADEVFGLDLSPPSVPRAIDEVSIAAWVDAGPRPVDPGDAERGGRAAHRRHARAGDGRRGRLRRGRARPRSMTVFETPRLDCGGGDRGRHRRAARRPPLEPGVSRPDGGLRRHRGRLRPRDARARPHDVGDDARAAHVRAAPARRRSVRRRPGLGWTRTRTTARRGSGSS